MKRYLVITIDVEPDCSKDWRYSDPLTFDGVHEGIGRRLQPLFLKYNIVPTYMINNVVLEDASVTSFFKKPGGRFELGAHLHPEFIEPQKEFFQYAGKSGKANCCFYDPAIEAAKIASITSLFENNFGYRPQSFRAGRYSAGANTIRSLASLGYKVDSSVTPHIRWDDATREKPVDFTSAPLQPYFVSEDSIVEAHPEGKILEVPITIGLKKRNIIKEFISSAGGLRHSIRTNKPVWLRPFYSSAKKMEALVNHLTNEYEGEGPLVFNMMFHNVEVLPGLSPYTASEADCRNYLEQLERFFFFCNKSQIEAIGLSELYHVYRPQS